MKKIMVALLYAVPALGQETYTLQANSAQVSDLTQIIGASNELVCKRFGLPRTCTQVEVCTAANARNPTFPDPCTNAEARNAGIRIFPETFAGREEYVTFYIAAPGFRAARSIFIEEAQKEQCAFWRTASRAEKDQACQSSGLQAGCELCEG